MSASVTHTGKKRTSARALVKIKYVSTATVTKCELDPHEFQTVTLTTWVVEVDNLPLLPRTTKKLRFQAAMLHIIELHMMREPIPRRK